MTLENNKKPCYTVNKMDELRPRFQNSEQNMDKYSNDTYSNDPHFSGPLETNKTNLKFSVESILNGTSGSKCLEEKSIEKVCALQKTSNPDDCNRIYRPMPMRYTQSNLTLYHGKG